MRKRCRNATASFLNRPSREPSDSIATTLALRRLDVRTDSITVAIVQSLSFVFVAECLRLAMEMSTLLTRNLFHRHTNCRPSSDSCDASHYRLGCIGKDAFITTLARPHWRSAGRSEQGTACQGGNDLLLADLRSRPNGLWPRWLPGNGTAIFQSLMSRYRSNRCFKPHPRNSKGERHGHFPH